MTAEEIKKIIKARHKEYDTLAWDLKQQDDNRTWYAGRAQGLMDALELIGMLGKENNRAKSS